MTISLDFDDTFTADPKLWTAFVRQAHARGHTVLLVTNRPALFRAEVDAAVAGLPFREVIFAGRTPKRLAARRRGYEVHVWVDDLPHTVEYGR